MKCIKILLASLALMAFTSEASNLKTEYYDSLFSLQNAGPPREVEMLRIDRASRNRIYLQKGILFTYKNRDARDSSIAGDFSGWNLTGMERSKNGVWYYFLGEYKNDKTVRYKFIVDGIWMADPANPDRADDGTGSYVSTVLPVQSGEGRYVSFRILKKNYIEFRIYRPKAKFISVIGDFNHWNPENDLLKKGDDGIWRLRKRIPTGMYRYRYIIDGAWQPDIYNPLSGSDDTGEICSILKIEE